MHLRFYLRKVLVIKAAKIKLVKTAVCNFAKQGIVTGCRILIIRLSSFREVTEDIPESVARINSPDNCSEGMPAKPFRSGKG